MKYINTLKLLLPALIPSWNFFDVIAPSPRIQFRLLNSKNEAEKDWQEFRPRPTHISFLQMLKRMFWNPKWNESLFLVSCAERIVDTYTKHSEDEILNRIENDLKQRKNDTTSKNLQFRLVFIQRKKNELHQKVVFTSRIKEIYTGDGS